MSWNAWRGLDLTVQFAGNSRVFNAPTNLAGDAVAVTFGGSYRTVAGWRFDLGIAEDIQVKLLGSSLQHHCNIGYLSC